MKHFVVSFLLMAALALLWCSAADGGLVHFPLRVGLLLYAAIVLGFASRYLERRRQRINAVDVST